MQEHFYFERNEPSSWMRTTPYIEHLTLGELTWPGAHNAGMDAKAPKRNGYMTCQSGPIDWQLKQGVRALDLRFRSYRNQQQTPCFSLIHGSESGRHLGDVILALEAFLDEHPEEFIILDVHQLSGRNKSPFHYQDFHAAIIDGLGERLIPYANRHLTLRQLRARHALQRIVLACPWHPELQSQLRWPPIRHKWSGKALIMTAALYKYLSKVMVEPPDSDELWSLSATTYSLFGVRTEGRPGWHLSGEGGIIQRR